MNAARSALPLLVAGMLSRVDAADLEQTLGQPTNAPPVAIRQFTDNTARGKISRCVLQAGSDQFTWVVPDGFRAQAEPSSGTLQLRTLQSPVLLTIVASPAGSREGSLDGSAPPPQPTATEIEAEIRHTLPQALVVDRFTVMIGHRPATIVEVEYNDASGLRRSERWTKIHFPNSTVRISAKAPTLYFRSCDHAFNQLLLSMRVGTQGAPAGYQQFLPDL